MSNIPGLVNLNNNCFLNSILQGLASCEKFIHYVEKIAWMQKNYPEFKKQQELIDEQDTQEQRHQKNGLRSKAANFMKNVLEFFVGTSEGEIDSLAIALQTLLQQLQPQQATSYQSASNIQHHLESQSNILDWGYHNDVAEALQVLLDILQTEARTHYIQNIQQILYSPSYILQSNTEQNQQISSPSCYDVRCMLGILDQGSVIQGWQSVGISPLEFNVVYKMTCSICSYRYPLEFQIQNCLSVDIPTCGFGSEQSIKLGTTLEHCLKSSCSLNFIEDVRCPRCSLRHLLKQIELFQSQNYQQNGINIDNNNINMVVKKLEWFTKSMCSYMPTDKYVQQILQNACIQLEDVKSVTSRAVRQTQIASFPQILSIQLKRGQFNWESGMSSKLSGHIQFPLILNLKNISGLFYQIDQNSEKKLCYQLCAVIVHLGAHSGGGHYIVYRRVIYEDQNDANWFRISDCRVGQVQEQEVLSCEASLLLYELSNEIVK